MINSLFLSFLYPFQQAIVSSKKIYYTSRYSKHNTQHDLCEHIVG